MQNADKPPTANRTVESSSRPYFGFRYLVGIFGFLVVAGYFLWTEHEAHIRTALPYLPWLLLLTCPLMHIFMHGGHGQDNSGSGDAPNQPRDGKE